MPETTSPTHHHQNGAADATCYTAQELVEAPPTCKPRASRRPYPDHATVDHQPVREPPRNPAADSRWPPNARSGQQGPTRSGRARPEAARRGEPASPSITHGQRCMRPRRPWPPRRAVIAPSTSTSQLGRARTSCWTGAHPAAPSRPHGHASGGSEARRPPSSRSPNRAKLQCASPAGESAPPPPSLGPDRASPAGALWRRRDWRRGGEETVAALGFCRRVARARRRGGVISMPPVTYNNSAYDFA